MAMIAITTNNSTNVKARAVFMVSFLAFGFTIMRRNLSPKNF
jgi:hypothetical protein